MALYWSSVSSQEQKANGIRVYLTKPGRQKGRMGARDSQGLGRLLPPNPTHQEAVYVFCLPKTFVHC